MHIPFKSALAGKEPSAPALLFGALILLLYAPTLYGLARGPWQDDVHSHGPFVLAGVVWLFADGLRPSRHSAPSPRAPASVPAGWALLVFGLLAYVLGRSQEIIALEVGSAIPVLIACILMSAGPATIRRLWFCFAFMLFLVPLPGSVVDVVTQPMKIAVTFAAELLLHGAGYPVAKQGVVLGIGPYQLFVADACAGLNSLFMLEAFGLLYLNVVRHESALRHVALAVLIVPISFAANVARVMALALVTYHYGDAVGQGVIHTFSGVLLFVVALALTVAADGILRTFQRLAGFPALPRLARAKPSPPAPSRQARPSPVSALAAFGAALLALFASTALAPKLPMAVPQPDLAAAIPEHFGDWSAVEIPYYAQVDVVASGPGAKSTPRPYDQVVMRAYRNSAGQVVGLAVAYSAHQRQEVKIHRPDLCYVAAGYRVVELSPITFAGLGGAAHEVRGIRMYADSSSSSEAVSYWIRVGDIYSESAWQSRWHIFLEGLRGQLTDGVLVRATMTVGRPDDARLAYPVLEAFLVEMQSSVAPSARSLLIR